MGHRPLQRALSTLLVAWFALVTLEPVALHSCPVHGWSSAAPLGPAPVSSGAVNPAGATPVPLGADADDHADHGPAIPAHSGDGEEHDCACIGDCAPPSSASALPATRTAFVQTDTRQIRLERPSAESPSITAPEFLLPYANGPPAGHRIA